MEPTTFYLHSLGCAKNRVDSEVILGLLVEGGYQLTRDPLEAGVIVVNTCAFIENATQESIDTILELAQAKKEGQCEVLVVAGCLPQRYGRKIAKFMPEVDLLVGTSSFSRLLLLLEFYQAGDPQQVHIDPPRFLMTAQTPRLLTAPFYSGYLKIAEGCANHCTFCAIPAIRGPYRSRPLDDLLQEAESLASQGVIELNLVAQDTTAYGEDLGNTPRIADLLDALAKADLFSWIRLLYGHPQRISRRLLEVMGSHDCICGYLDLPFQHASPRILEKMARTGSSAEFLGLVKTIRKHLPKVALRTTLMVGFPGERETDFQELAEFVEQACFQRLGLFAYSAEKGTAAARLADLISDEVKQERLDKLVAIQEQISLRLHQDLVGTIQPVLIEGTSLETELLLEGRHVSQAPEVDGRVYINRGVGQVGKIMEVRITEAHPHDLVGEVIASDLL
jgi:ribosomal protein S12 methylthiotransferase